MSVTVNMRLVRQQHHTPHGTLDICYDRFTTRFSVISQTKPVYHCWLGLWPFRRVNLILNQQPYQLRIFWFILWRARLKGPVGFKIDELLNARKRQSYIFAGYTTIILIFRVGVSVLS